jgi:hypothetical protein
MAHLERASYWPDPAPDCDVSPCAGGEVPKIRSLSSALKPTKQARTRVVCQSDSLRLLNASVGKARRDGYDIRPTDHRALSKQQGRLLKRINARLFKRCKYHEIQPAVTASDNDDRVVVMPGVYTEPTASAKKKNDPACAQYRIFTDKDGGASGAVSYAYQYHCPNDQQLVAVIGREPGAGSDPQPPRWERFGIPNLGKCIRCNLQLEGSGVSADDVVVEAGNAKNGDKGPNGVGARKDVGIRADRADGFVLRNIKVRHALEHGIYVIETDGYMLDRFKAFYNGAYGTLTFALDHGVQQNCEAVGHGDSGLYPGSPAETGEQRQPGTQARLNQEIRYCDMHHNMAGFSATNGNAIRIHHNEMYDNALGLTTDIMTAPGHPGFPDDSMVIEDNNIYSNNFNLFTKDSDVEPLFPFPTGTGMWIAGGNNHTIRRNRFYDNWRRAAMLFSIPDALICGIATTNRQSGCDADTISTSFRNKFYDNVMGIAPDGTRKPNGTDFWWDAFPGNAANCWWDNGKVTSFPSALPSCDGGKSPSQSLGLGNVGATAELYYCGAGFALGTPNLPDCPWFETPPKPGTRAARAAEAAQRAAYVKSFSAFCNEFGEVPTCAPLLR